MTPLPGEVWLADLGLAAKTRPVIIGSRQDLNPRRALVLYVPLTTQRFSSYEVPWRGFPFSTRTLWQTFKDLVRYRLCALNASWVGFRVT
jgi:mRNA-degrading endonuclease toxin of MazEF toxin-antitoxin module